MSCIIDLICFNDLSGWLWCYNKIRIRALFSYVYVQTTMHSGSDVDTMSNFYDHRPMFLHFAHITYLHRLIELSNFARYPIMGRKRPQRVCTIPKNYGNRPQVLQLQCRSFPDAYRSRSFYSVDYMPPNQALPYCLKSRCMF